MARKAVLSGGKRDEIISKAMRLFFEKGYEATSVRMIMEKAGGEIGMFYHYFRSKDELFDRVADRFFEQYREDFEKALSSVNSIEEFADQFLPLYKTSMNRFEKLRGNMHWTIQCAMHDKTLGLLIQPVTEFIGSLQYEGSHIDMFAGELVYGISGLIHSDSFMQMDDESRRGYLLSFIRKVLDQ